ncbi:antitoxin family protein [[Phormidium] sp. ETS-05]|uniref:antitoxin family protein n=1 Tax=[Phormidium] sp. ETS-05 TaxID=222819 RepID=UPI0018EF1763|nr:antitoxin family protein [[Phormidium] sp. ETS-05]
MKQILDAIYENGVFRPLKNIDISEGQSVRLIVETTSSLSPEDLLNLAAQVYEGLSDEDIQEIEELARDRRNFFGE